MIFIVTRHGGAIEWLSAKGYTGEVVTHLTADQVRPGNKYIRMLRIPMVHQVLENSSRFLLLNLQDIAYAQRERELSPEKMDQAGVRMIEVKRIELVTVG